MATLVLTAAGTLVGGPIGGALGAALGSQIDRRLLGSTRTGPRLGDLSVQLSSYGTDLPRLFGRMRIAGTVIWATDLREDTHHAGGGKAGGKTTTYSYSASFAVALSARPILRVERIWADGNLLRGAAGDWKADTGFRLHLGTEDQAPDPLIASAEGIASAPAHRGLAYAVFEGLQLADYGNRIPSLTFEVVADEAPVTIAAIAASLSEGPLAGEGGVALTGYAATGGSIRASLDPLAQCRPLPLCDDGAILAIAPDGAVAIEDAALGASADDGRVPLVQRSRASTATLPDEIALTYYEPVRDYQAGLQRARRSGIGTRAEAIDLAAALSASAAKGIADAVLAQRWTARETATADLPWRYLEARAGSLADSGGVRWRVKRWELERMALKLTLAQEAGTPAPTPASAGRPTSQADVAAGATVLQLVDLPMLDDGAATAPQLWLAAAGTAPGWRRAEASLSLDGGASWSALGRTALPATVGTAATALAPGPRDLFDRTNMVEVALLHDDMALAGATPAMLIAGSNAALIGDEIIQFGAATQIGSARWRLGMLLRGRRGSEAAIATHVAGERFLLLDPATLLPVPVPMAALGGTVQVSALGPGDGGTAALASLRVKGRAIRPPAPVHIRAARLADGTVRIGWIRRSRAGWAWLSGNDVPLGEDRERYRLTIRGAGGAARTVETDEPTYDYQVADQLADGAGVTFAMQLVQLGSLAPSDPPAATTLTV